MKTKTKKILKWVGIVFGGLILIVVCLGIYLNSVLPKFNSVPIVLQKELFEKPKVLLPMEGKFIYKSASELAILIRSKKATSLEIVTEFINHIKNNNYKYNALIYLREKEAIEDAKLADMAIAAGDTLNKPLLGVPITIKELYWVKGSPSTLNVKMYGFIAPRNAAVVSQLKSAGAVILGTTNVPIRLSDYQTQGEVYPTASNPFDLTRTPGGSTGGGAAAVAAGFSPFELGSDLGGSIRVPATYCGLWALKTSFGAINITDGTNPDSSFAFNRFAMASAGPLARDPKDLQLMWNVLVNTKIDSKFQKPIAWKEASNKKLSDYKFAWVDEWPTKQGKIKVSETTKGKMKLLKDSLLNRKASLVEDTPLDYYELHNMFLRTFGFMLSENQPWLIKKLIQLDFQKSDDGSGNFEIFNESIMDGSVAGWEKTQQERQKLILKWEAFFTKYDFFICPVTYDAAFKKQESWKDIKADDGNTINYMGYVPYSYIINATGHPAITVPLGLNKLGLPIGIQIVGPMYSEPELLHLAELLYPLTSKFVAPKTLKNSN